MYLEHWDVKKLWLGLSIVENTGTNSKRTKGKDRQAFHKQKHQKKGDPTEKNRTRGWYHIWWCYGADE